jgi:ActR/RegA family two-component response regulator
MLKLNRYIVVPFSLAAGSAMAAVPTEVSTALTDMKADALTVAGFVLVAIIAVSAIKFIRKGL